MFSLTHLSNVSAHICSAKFDAVNAVASCSAAVKRIFHSSLPRRQEKNGACEGSLKQAASKKGIFSRIHCLGDVQTVELMGLYVDCIKDQINGRSRISSIFSALISFSCRDGQSSSCFYLSVRLCTSIFMRMHLYNTNRSQASRLLYCKYNDKETRMILPSGVIYIQVKKDHVRP